MIKLLSATNLNIIDMNPDEESNRNIGWWHIEALRFVAQRGRWPEELTACERHTIRRAGLVELIYRGRPRKGLPTRIPRLTSLAYKFLEGI